MNRIITAPRWIWQSPQWPQLTYDAKRLGGALAAARTAQGRLLGKAEAVGGRDMLAFQRDAWASEAVATAAIEGESLNLDAVRSSVGRRLGISPDFVAVIPRNVEGLLDVMEDAAARWDGDLDGERLCRWQSALFPAGLSSIHQIETGRYRTHEGPMQIVSGPVHNPAVHFEAIPVGQIPSEMERLLGWFNRTRQDGSTDGIVRAGLAHLWFETIHPFEDGNGRIGRALVDMALAQDARMSYRVHGVSAVMRQQQKAYYDALNVAQRGRGEVTGWLTWFIGVFATSCDQSERLIDEALARARFWAEHSDVNLNDRQRKALHRMLDAGPGRFEGGMTPRKYQALTGAGTTLTASRDLADLVVKGLLRRKGGGRSTYYDLAIPGWGLVKATGPVNDRAPEGGNP